MPSRVRVKHKLGGYAEVRRAPGVRSKLEGISTSIAARCNSRAGITNGYRTSSQQGKQRGSYRGRWRTTVITATAEAMLDNAKHNRLIKELHE